MKSTDFEKRIRRVNIYGIIGLLYSIYLLCDYFFKNKVIWELIISITLFIISIIFLLASRWLKSKKK